MLFVIKVLLIKIPSFLSIQEVFSANLLLSRSKYVLPFFLDIVFTPSPFKSITIGEVLVEAGVVSGKVSFGLSYSSSSIILPVPDFNILAFSLSEVWMIVGVTSNSLSSCLIVLPLKV